MMLGRLFVDHPRSLGMSWLGHGLGAVGIGARMMGAGAACVVHAIVPGLFTQTAGRTVEQLYQQMASRRASTDNWPDYEI